MEQLPERGTRGSTGVHLLTLGNSTPGRQSFLSGHIDSAGKCISQGISAERKRGACCSVSALRKHHRPIAREQFLTVLASGKLETKVLVDCVSGEGQFPGFLVCRLCLLVVYSFVGRTKESLGFNYKDCNPIQKFYFSIPGY